MLDTLSMGVRLSLEPSTPHTDTTERVEALLSRPLLARTINHGLSGVLPEHQFKDICAGHQLPHYFLRELESARMVGYAQGVDRLGLDRIAFLYYNRDEVLTLTEVQRGIPQTFPITREGLGDSEVIERFFESGFVPYLPSGAYPQADEL